MNDLAVVGLEWLGGVTIFLGFILLLRYLEHRERMTMIEHGLWQPEANQPPRYPRGSAQLRGGLITAGVGFALTVGLYNLGWLLPAPLTAAPGRIGPWLLPGLIPLAVGLALIIGYYLSPPNPQQGNKSEKAPNAAKAAKAAKTEAVDASSEHDIEGAAHSRGTRQRSGWYLVNEEGQQGNQHSAGDDIDAGNDTYDTDDNDGDVTDDVTAASVEAEEDDASKSGSPMEARSDGTAPSSY